MFFLTREPLNAFITTNSPFKKYDGRKVTNISKLRTIKFVLLSRLTIGSYQLYNQFLHLTPSLRCSTPTLVFTIGHNITNLM